MQETKTTDENFPADELEAAGYHVVFSGQKTYNGVAIISKQPASDIITDVAGLDDPQRRILGATIDGVRVLNLYVVNGQEVGSEKYAHKLHWLEKVTDHMANSYSSMHALWWSVISTSHRMTVMYMTRKPGTNASSAAPRNARPCRKYWTWD